MEKIQSMIKFNESVLNDRTPSEKGKVVTGIYKAVPGAIKMQVKDSRISNV